MNVNEALQKASNTTSIRKCNTDTWCVRYHQPGLHGFFKECRTADFKSAKVRAKYCKLDAFMILMDYDVTSCTDNPVILSTQDDWQAVARNLHKRYKHLLTKISG